MYFFPSLPFKYISCYCLSVIGSLLTACIAYSNTSHVIVYPGRRTVRYSIPRIQIHLMLLFILCGFLLFNRPPLFKYISCYCLSTTLPAGRYRNRNSNTSHVIVYLGISLLDFPGRKIQIHLMLLFIYPPYFLKFSCPNSNTSHVIVYLRAPSRIRISLEFKYISCYCLSHFTLSFRQPEVVFKYISCYCLSGSYRTLSPDPPIQIHLMLLFILPRQEIRASHRGDSNTSHVIVYPRLSTA